MKRLIGALLLVLGLVVPPAQIAEAAPKVKDCAAFTYADGRYSTFEGVAPPTASVSFDTAAPSCSRNVQYTLTARTVGGQLITSASIAGDGETSGLRIEFLVPGQGSQSPPDAVCLQLESRSHNGRVLDVAPVAGSEGDSSECIDAVAFYAPLNAPPGALRMK